jgi:hypothetical protein
MKLSSLFTSKSLKPAWSFSANHTLWRLHFSDAGFIVGEDRNTEQKTTSFFCLEEKSGEAKWKQKTFGENWWIGIEAVTNDRVFLHGFKKPDMPEHKKIICVDLLSSNELWRNEQFAFHSTLNEFVFASRDLFERRLYYRLNALNGEMIEELNELPLELENSDQNNLDKFVFPAVLSEESAEFQEILSFARKLITDNNILHQTEYIFHNNFLICNVYSSHAKEQGLTNTLYILDTQKKKTVFREVLNGFTPYPVPDSFFLYKNSLYYIRERKTLVSIHLV